MAELMAIVEGLLNIGLPAILMYQLLIVWNRLVVVTDKLIELNAKFEAYREETEIYRAQVAQELRITNAIGK